jgi:hypothetical protein
MFTALLVLIATLGSGAADAAGSGQDYQLIAPPNYVFERFRPDGAACVGGDVELRCVAGPDQTLTACKMAREDPPERGFGLAALRLAERYRLKRPPGWTPGPAPETITVSVSWPRRSPGPGGLPPNTQRMETSQTDGHPQASC